MLKNKIHYYKSNLNRGKTSFNVYNSKDNDLIKQGNFTEGSVSNGVFVQATRWQSKLNAQAIKDESDGYGFPKDIKLPSIKVGVADNANINTDLLKVRFAPSFISTNGTNFKTINAGAYKLLDAVQETNPFYEEAEGDNEPVAKSVAIGTKTAKLYIVLMLDNSTGIYTQAENFSALVRPFLVGGAMNWIYEDKSVTGYRGQKGTSFPVRLGVTNENPAGTEDSTRDGILKQWEFKFNMALDPVVPSMVTKEGSLNGKPYKMQMITFGSFTGQDVPNFHEDKITAGLNIKGVIGIYQLGETEEDRANFIECSILDSNTSFTTKDDGTQVEQTILETLAGQGLISTENLRLLSLEDSDTKGDNPIYALGMHYPLSYLYDITLGQHNEGDVPVGASIITAFEELKQWEGIETNIKLDKTLSGQEDEFVLKYPVVCYPKLEYSQAVIDAVGTIPAPAKPNQLYFEEAKECLAFGADLGFLWDTAQTNDEAWSDDEKLAIVERVKEAEDYNTGLYSYNTMIEAIKAVFLARDNETALEDSRVEVYESLFKRQWNGGSETDNVLKDSYEVQCWKPYYCDEPIKLLGLTENSMIDNPCYLLWNSSLTEIQVPVTSHIHNDAEINGYYKPKGVVASVGNIIFGAKELTADEVKADLEYARVWKDIEGKDAMKSALVEDLYSLRELYDQMNKQGVPVLDTSRSDFFKNLCYGRVKDKMPIGAWWFMNCHKDAWVVEDSIIDSVWWEKGENFDDYLYAEESDNPDLNCKIVSFRVKEGVIDTDYFKDKNAPKIYCSIYYCANAKNGKETKQEFRFEIVEPIVLGVLTRVRQQTGITNNMWSQGAYANIGQFWYKKWINRPLSELDSLGIQPKDRLFHCNNVAMGMTPRYMVYKHEPTKRYELPILAIPAYVMNEDAKLDVDKRKYNRFEVTATDGSKHIIPVSAMNTDTKDARFTAGLSADADTDFGGGGGSYHVDNYSLIYGYGVGLEKNQPVDTHLVDFGKGVYIRDRVLCSAYSYSYSYSSSSAASSAASLCPIYIESSPNQLNLQPENYQYRGGSWGAGERTSSFKTECSTEWFEEFCDTRYGANGYPKADKWLRIEQIYIPASDKTDNSGYLVTRWMWEGEDFVESDLYDNTKWKEMLSPVKDGYIIFARGKRPIHLIADYNCWITDISAIKIYQTDGLIKAKKLPSATSADKASERLAKTTQYANAIYSALQDLDNSIASGLLEPKFDITRDECRYGEFMQFDDNGDPIGKNVMQPNSAQWCYDTHQWATDINWLPYSDNGFKGQHPQINMNYSGQVQGFQELGFEALVLDKDTMTWYLPKSPFSEWLDHEAGLPFCTDYQRQVKMRKVKLDDPDDITKCWAIYDSLNYELKVSGDYTNLSKLQRYDGREWNTRQDFMYDCFTFRPRTHYVKFEFETRDVSLNIQARYRFEAVSMGEFEIDPNQLIKQLRGKDTTEQIVCVKGWTLDTTKFFNPTGASNLLEADKGETARFLGSCRITNKDMSQDYTSSDTEDVNLGYYVCSVSNSNVRVFSVPHRAFLGVYAPDGGFDYDHKTQKFTPKIFQDNDGVLKNEVYTGYWLSANPVSIRKRTEETEYDTVNNYDLTFTDWFYQTGAYYLNTTTPTFQTKRTLNGVSVDLMNRGDLEWTVMGGAPETLNTGRIIGSVNYGNDLSWNGKLGYIPARFIGKNKALIKTQLGMMGLMNRQLVDLQWIEWGIEQLGKISSYSQSALHWYKYSSAYEGGSNANWLPAAYLWNGNAITHGNITQTFSSSSSSSSGGSSSSSSSSSGIGSIEYAINNFIKLGTRKVGTVKNPCRPCIDYRYFNHTRDCSSILSGLNAPNNANNKSYGSVSLYYPYIAQMSSYRGRSFVVQESSIPFICGTEKVFPNNINALGYTGGNMMLYAPYGYDLPMGLSWNKNQADTSLSYGYNHKNNPRIQVLLCNKGSTDIWGKVLNEGVGNSAFTSSVNVVSHHNGSNYIYNSYATYPRECNVYTHTSIVRNWASATTISSAMGSQDGTLGYLGADDLGTRGGTAINERYYSKAQIFLNFPSVCSPFNFNLKHGSPDDLSHQPSMLLKKKPTT